MRVKFIQNQYFFYAMDLTIDGLSQLEFDLLETLVRCWGIVSSTFFIGRGRGGPCERAPI